MSPESAMISITLASSPFQLVTESTQTAPAVSTLPGSGSWLWPAVALIFIVVAGFVLVVRRRRASADPLGYGTRRLCALLRLSRGEQRVLESLARAHGVATPGGLLLSRSAMETSAALLRSSASPAERAATERLFAKIR